MGGKNEQNALARAALSVEHVVAARFRVIATPEGSNCDGYITTDVVTAEETSRVFTEIRRGLMNVPGGGTGLCELHSVPEFEIPEDVRDVRVNPHSVPLSEDEGAVVLVSTLYQLLEDAVYAIEDVFEVEFSILPVANAEATCEMSFVTDVSSREEVSEIFAKIRDSIGDFRDLKGSLDCSVSAIPDHGQFPTVVESVVINEGLDGVRIDDNARRVLQP